MESKSKAVFPFLWTLYKKDLSNLTESTSQPAEKSVKQSQTYAAKDSIDYRVAQIAKYQCPNYFKSDTLYLTKFSYRDIDYNELVQKNYAQLRQIMGLKDDLLTIANQFDDWCAEHEIWMEHFKYMESTIKGLSNVIAAQQEVLFDDFPNKIRKSLAAADLEIDDLRRRLAKEAVNPLDKSEDDYAREARDRKNLVKGTRVSFKDRPRRP